MTDTISQKLREYTAQAKLYPLVSLEDFCNKQSILLCELYIMATNNKELNDAIQYFRQKQKALMIQLLTVQGNIVLSNKDGSKQTITLDKKGIYILAKQLGIE
jgi:hypothetical protein